MTPAASSVTCQVVVLMWTMHVRTKGLCPEKLSYRQRHMDLNAAHRTGCRQQGPIDQWRQRWAGRRGGVAAQATEGPWTSQTAGLNKVSILHERIGTLRAVLASVAAAICYVLNEGLACESCADITDVTLHMRLLSCRRLKNGTYVIPVTATHAAVSSAMALHAAQQAPTPAAISAGVSPHHAPSSAAEAAAAVIAAAAAALPGGVAGVSFTQAADALEAVLAAADVAMMDFELRARWRAQMPNELDDADGSDNDMFTDQVWVSFTA